MKFEIPPSIRLEHQELHAELAHATKFAGRTGEVARSLAVLLHAHFAREEEFALPPLGLLPALAKGRVEPWMEEVLVLTARLKDEMQSMLDEHRSIIDGLRALSGAAEKENHPELLDFSERLMEHAEFEEEVGYPAAILVGEFVRMRLGVR